MAGHNLERRRAHGGVRVVEPICDQAGKLVAGMLHHRGANVGAGIIEQRFQSRVGRPLPRQTGRSHQADLNVLVAEAAIAQIIQMRVATPIHRVGDPSAPPDIAARIQRRESIRPRAPQPGQGTDRGLGHILAHLVIERRDDLGHRLFGAELAQATDRQELDIEPTVPAVGMELVLVPDDFVTARDDQSAQHRGQRRVAHPDQGSDRGHFDIAVGVVEQVVHQRLGASPRVLPRGNLAKGGGDIGAHIGILVQQRLFQRAGRLGIRDLPQGPGRGATMDIDAFEQDFAQDIADVGLRHADCFPCGAVARL